MKELEELICDIHPLTEPDMRSVLDSGEELFIPKGERIISIGDVNRSLYLIISGVWRAYYSVEDREVTVWFVLPGETAFSSWGYMNGKPSLLNIEAASDSVVYRFPKSDLDRLFTASIDLSVWGRKMFENMLLVTDQWMVDFTHPLASKRYISLSEKMPDLLQYVPLKDIAGFLGVTPQSLSRIRKNLTRNNG